MAEFRKVYYKTKELSSLIGIRDEQLLRIAKKYGIEQKKRGRWSYKQAVQLVQHYYPVTRIMSLIDFYGIANNFK
tara:strand:+ start:10758 stop:10982 length:225 start_codon:yes stop_codon:yes gene_type:complete